MFKPPVPFEKAYNLILSITLENKEGNIEYNKAAEEVRQRIAKTLERLHEDPRIAKALERLHACISKG